MNEWMDELYINQWQPIDGCMDLWINIKKNKPTYLILDNPTIFLTVYFTIKISDYDRLRIRNIKILNLSKIEIFLQNLTEKSWT